MLYRIYFVHYALDTSIEQYYLIMEFVENFLGCVTHINIVLLDIILHFHVYEEVIESGLSFSHLIFCHLVRLQISNFMVQLPFFVSLIYDILLQSSIVLFMRFRFLCPAVNLHQACVVEFLNLL